MPRASTIRRIRTTVFATLTSAAFAAPALAQFDFDVTPIRQDGLWNARSSAAIDEAGVVHLCHVRQTGTDSSTSEVWYGTNATGTWDFTQVTTNTVREEFPDLTLDAAGNVHIAVHTGAASSNKIRYTNNISGSFFDPVDITLPGFVIVSHAIDSEGTAHMVFQSQTGTLREDVYYATRTAAGAVTGPTNISNSPTVNDAEATIALDSQGVAHVVWEKGSALGYATNAGGSFVEVPTGVATRAEFPIVLISTDDVVSIIYRESLTNGLLWAVDNTSGSFGATEPVIPAGEYRPSSWEGMAIDSDGRRHLCFSSNGSTTTQGVFFVGETDAGFQDPVFLGLAASSHLGGSVGVNSSGQIVASFELTGFDGSVFADLHVAILQTGFDSDLDGNGVTDVFDLLAYLSLWFPQNPGADIDGTSGIDVFDLLFYLDAWFNA